MANKRQTPLQRYEADPLARLRRIHAANSGIPGADPDSLDRFNAVRRAATAIFKTNDGKILLDWMIEASYGVVVPDYAPDSALRDKESRKKFVAAIAGLVIEDTDGRRTIPSSAPAGAPAPGKTGGPS